ncbi:MAG: hypothetical protein IPK63_01525 [Candidatus Competibacteraceae bacterium]|nr:hypothetical protein [Candidatus Competibacteraceae bacterium]
MAGYISQRYYRFSLAKWRHKVIMRLDSRTQGLQFNLGVSGVKVTVDKEAGYSSFKKGAGVI